MENKRGANDRKMILSTLWVFVTLNYLFVNVFKLLGEVAPTTAEEVELVSTLSTPEMFLFAAVYLELAMAMIVLSRLLKRSINRWANIIIAALHTLGAVASLSVVSPPAFYVFFVVVEVVALLFIVWYAWSWRNLYE